MVYQKKQTNYLLPALGGLLLLSILAIAAFSLAPLEGCVGVIEIKDTIVTEDIGASLFSDEVIGAETIARQIESANERADVKSVLILIDTPGGSVVGTRTIYDALQELDKPKIAHINEMGTSGGYYVAAGTDYIISNPDAITGNIGARATLTDMSGLFSKIGYNETTLKTGDMKDIGNPARPMTDEEKAVFQSIVEESFQEFKAAVEKGREGKLSKEGFETVLDGRVVSGRQAKKIGLVDELGNKKAAIRKAAEMGGIESDEPMLCTLSSSGGQRGIFSSFSSEMASILQNIPTKIRLAYQ